MQNCLSFPPCPLFGFSITILSYTLLLPDIAASNTVIYDNNLNPLPKIGFGGYSEKTDNTDQIFCDNFAGGFEPVKPPLSTAVLRHNSGSASEMTYIMSK